MEQVAAVWNAEQINYRLPAGINHGRKEGMSVLIRKTGKPIPQKIIILRGLIRSWETDAHQLQQPTGSKRLKLQLRVL
jgi:hypothetical protein